MIFYITGKKPKGIGVTIDNLVLHTRDPHNTVYSTEWETSDGNGGNEKGMDYDARFKGITFSDKEISSKWLIENVTGIEICLDLDCAEEALLTNVVIKVNDKGNCWKFSVPVFMEDSTPAKSLTLDDGESCWAEKDGIKVEIENIGEGLSGDYNEEDPEDVNLLRFTVYQKVGKDFEVVDDASYCTNIPADIPKVLLERALDYLLREFHNVLHSDPCQSVKKLGERLSWISPRELIYSDDDILKVLDDINDRCMQFSSEEHDQLDAIAYSIKLRKDLAAEYAPVKA